MSSAEGTSYLTRNWESVAALRLLGAVSTCVADEAAINSATAREPGRIACVSDGPAPRDSRVAADAEGHTVNQHACGTARMLAPGHIRPPRPRALRAKTRLRVAGGRTLPNPAPMRAQAALTGGDHGPGRSCSVRAGAAHAAHNALSA